MWTSASVAGSGPTEPMVVEITTLYAGVVTGPITETWTIAPGGAFRRRLLLDLRLATEREQWCRDAASAGSRAARRLSERARHCSTRTLQVVPLRFRERQPPGARPVQLSRRTIRKPFLQRHDEPQSPDAANQSRRSRLCRAVTGRLAFPDEWEPRIHHTDSLPQRFRQRDRDDWTETVAPVRHRHRPAGASPGLERAVREDAVVLRRRPASGVQSSRLGARPHARDHGLQFEQQRVLEPGRDLSSHHAMAGLAGVPPQQPRRGVRARVGERLRELATCSTCSGSQRPLLRRSRRPRAPSDCHGRAGSTGAHPICRTRVATSAGSTSRRSLPPRAAATPGCSS